MNSIESTKNVNVEERIDSTSLFFIFGAAAALTGLVYYLLKREEKAIPTDPPPIVIKTGSFIIDSVDGFRDAGDISGNPKRKKVNKYKGNFGAIRSVLINIINEKSLDTSPPERPWGDFFNHSQGLNIEIWFQKLISENPDVWDSGDVTGFPDVVNRRTTHLELELPDNLNKSNQNKHPKRKNKDRLDLKKDSSGRDRYFRIGRIRISDFDGDVKCDIGSKNGDNYYISLWDVYVP